MLLPWITGPKQAKELLLTGDDRIDAADALRMGIVNHVVPAEVAFAKGMAIAHTMSRAAERSVRMTKRAINAQYEAMGLAGGLRSALDMDVLLNAGSSPEKKEFARIRSEQGVKAALAWRDARFK
jgi:enoyl-CoA hydratase